MQNIRILLGCCLFAVINNVAAQTESISLVCTGTGRMLKLGIGDMDKTVPVTLGVDLDLEKSSAISKASATITGHPVELPRTAQTRSMWGFAYPAPLNEVQLVPGAVAKQMLDPDPRHYMEINRNTGIATYYYRLDDSTGIFSFQAALKCVKTNRVF